LIVLTLVADITWLLKDNLARQSRDHYQNVISETRFVSNTARKLF